MTREQAKREIDNIDFYLQHHTDDYSERSHDAMMMAIQALSQEPTTTTNNNEPMTVIYPTIVCDDAISREDRLIDLANAIESDDSGYWTNKRISSALRNISSVTQKSETVTEFADRCRECGAKYGKLLEQKSGKWRIAHGMYEDRFWCSCGYIRIMDSRMNEWKYCPVCGGAKMVEPQERSDKECTKKI